MKKVDVLIIYEHKNRELESAVRLAVLLEKKGITSDIKQCGWNEAIAEFQISPKILVVPWCYDTKDLNKWLNYRGQLNKNRIQILNLHCEQVVFNDAIDFYLPKGKSKNIHHISWGPNYTKLLSQNNINDKLIHETGSIRLDFFKKQYCETREKLAEKYKLDYKKKWILLVGNFSQMSLTEERIKDLTNRGIGGIKEGKETATISFEKICTWYENLLEDKDIRKNIEFIYRPHPSEENNNILIELEKKYSNFHYISENAIRDWYVNSQLALVWTSTSSVEAYCAGIPVKALRPVSIPENIKIDLVEKLDKIKTIDEFKKIVYDLMENKNIVTNIEFIKEIEKYYGKINRDAGKETVELINNLLNDFDGSVLCHKIKSFKSVIKVFNFYIKFLAVKFSIANRIKKWEFMNRDRVNSKEIENLKQKYRKIEK